MANQSKYSFDEVEARLDAIKFDQGNKKVLAGDGTYIDISTAISSDVIQEAVDNAVKDTVDTTVEETLEKNTATDSDIDALFP